MPDYRRVFVPGACYFFTVVTANRAPVFAYATAVSALREAFRRERARRPFTVEAAVVLPDHLHCLWRLPDEDVAYPVRWREIKKYVSKVLGRSVWQRAYWEHCIRDEGDWQRHLDYIHYNPVRHGYVASAMAWPYSSFGRWLRCGYYSPGWGECEPEGIVDMEYE